MKTKPNEAIVNNATEDSGGKKEVDFTKEWSNGHKMLNTAQAGALTEILHQEERTRERFEKIKGDMKRPRNPLNGEPTPRDVRGEVVMNPKQFTTIRNGLPLFRGHEMQPTIPRRKKSDMLQGKIGVDETIYEVLGNSGASLTPSQPNDLFSFSRTLNEQKTQKMEEQTKINEYVSKEKAKRYEKELAREIQYLQQQMEEKAKKLHLLKTQYHV